MAKRARRIFSGRESKALWDAINAVGAVGESSKVSKIATALYLLGCRCQELEARLENALEKVKRLTA